MLNFDVGGRVNCLGRRVFATGELFEGKEGGEG